MTMLLDSANSSILAQTGSMFSAVKPIVFLLLAVVIGLNLVEWIIKMFYHRPSRRNTRDTTELDEINELGNLSKKYGVKVNTRQLLKEYQERQEHEKFDKLLKKYQATE